MTIVSSKKLSEQQISDRGVGKERAKKIQINVSSFMNEL